MAVFRKLGLVRGALVVALLSGLVACVQSPSVPLGPDGIYDPNEPRNRKVHAFNQKLLGRGNGTYAKVVPEEFQDVVHNVSVNLSMPQVAVNSLLQGDLRGTGLATYRFAVNSVLGVGGMYDAASAFKVDKHDTDFGETLHVWGVSEGKYQELPLLGPSTQRDTVGRVVDMFTDPLGYVVTSSPERYVGSVTSALDSLGKGDESAPRSAGGDSYAQSRDFYLRKRRAELSGF